MAKTGARSNAVSFGRQWERVDRVRGRTWAVERDARLEMLLADFDRPREWFAKKRVLDAGCGHGVATNLFASIGAHVTGMDVIDLAHTREAFPTLDFVQGDVSNPPFGESVFDAIYCGGVLHHTPDPRRGFGELAKRLRPGGLMYVWLYWRVPGALYVLKSRLRKLLAPFPYPVRLLPVPVFTAQAALRDRSVTRADHWLVQHDFFTPKWRSEHTPDEIHDWCVNLGLAGTLRSTSRDGFGVLVNHG